MAEDDIVNSETAAEPVAVSELPSEPAEAPLDIHKPKPVHSWREFLSEIGVIVIGVLIALSGEQLVEWLHWQHEVGETREALHAELARAVGSFQFRMARQPCIDRRLGELADWLDHSKPADTMKTVRPIGSPSSYAVLAGTWDVAKSGQDASHIPLQERLRYAHLYGALAAFSDIMTRDANTWQELADFDGAGPLDSAARMRLRGLVVRGRRASKVVSTYPRYIMPDVAALDVRPEPRPAFDAESDRAFCASLFAR